MNTSVLLIAFTATVAIVLLVVYLKVTEFTRWLKYKAKLRQKALKRLLSVYKAFFQELRFDSSTTVAKTFNLIPGLVAKLSFYPESEPILSLVLSFGSSEAEEVAKFVEYYFVAELGPHRAAEMLFKIRRRHDVALP